MRLFLPTTTAVFLLLLTGCESGPPTDVARPGAEQPVANALNPDLQRLPAVPLPRVAPGGPALALASPATNAACTSILIYDHNTHHGHARQAVTGMGLSFTRAGSADFNTLLTGQTWDLVIMDLPSNEPAGAWQTSLVDHIQAGGRAIHTHWNSTSLTIDLQSAFQISDPVAHQTQSFFQWNAHSLFTTPNAVPSAFDVWADVFWAINGFRVSATGAAVSAAGFTTEPTAGQAAIVIGNNGRTIFNGFLFDDYQPADQDVDGQKDIEELIQNEVEFVCAGVNETTEEVPAGETAAVTVEEDTDGDGDAEAVAGVLITPTEDVTVTVSLRPVSADAPCHDFLVGQIGRCLEITVEDEFGNPVPLNPLTDIIGLCIPEPFVDDLTHPFKFEDPRGRVLALRQTMATFLDCTAFTEASAMESSWLKQFAGGLVHRVGQWLAPRPLLAAHWGFGIIPGPGESFYTWARPIQISQAALAVGSNNETFGVSGVFDFTQTPPPAITNFNPAVHQVIVTFGDGAGDDDLEQSIGPGSGPGFFNMVRGSWVYNAPRGTRTGILSMSIQPGASGQFTVTGAVPKSGLGPSDRAYRSFTLQIGEPVPNPAAQARVQGAALECVLNTSGVCSLSPSFHP